MIENEFIFKNEEYYIYTYYVKNIKKEIEYNYVFHLDIICKSNNRQVMYSTLLFSNFKTYTDYDIVIASECIELTKFLSNIISKYFAPITFS